MRFPGRFNTASLVIAIDSWPLGLAQIPWPHPDSCTASIRPKNSPTEHPSTGSLDYFVHQPDSHPCRTGMLIAGTGVVATGRPDWIIDPRQLVPPCSGVVKTVKTVEAK